MKSLPHIIQLNNCLIDERSVVVSHSCVWPLWGNRVNNTAVFEEHVRNNRKTPEDSKGIFNIYGHQHKKQVETTAFSACIDTSAKHTLTAMHLPSRHLYSVDTIDI